jgi:hypothetical protein
MWVHYLPTKEISIFALDLTDINNIKRYQSTHTHRIHGPLVAFC